MYKITATHLDSEFGDAVMFEVTVFSETVADALERAYQERVYGPSGTAYVEVDQ